MQKKQNVFVELVKILKTRKGLLPICGVIFGVTLIIIACVLDDSQYHLLRIILTELGTLSITVLGVHLLYNIYLKKEDLDEQRLMLGMELDNFYKKIQDSISYDLSSDISKIENYISDGNLNNIFSTYIDTQKKIFPALIDRETKIISFDFSLDYERTIFDYIYINCLDSYCNSSFSGLSRLSDGYYWSMDDQKLSNVEKHIKLLFADSNNNAASIKKNMKRVFIYEDEITVALKKILDIQVGLGVIVKTISNTTLKKNRILIRDYFFFEDEGKVFWTVHYTPNKGEIHKVDLSTVSINNEGFIKMKDTFNVIWGMANEYHS